MSTVLLDTSFIIDFLRGQQAAKQIFDRLSQEGAIFACCAVNVEEVYAGVKQGEERITGQFLRALRYYPISRAAARKAGEYRRAYKEKGITLHTPDALIAAVVVTHGLLLLTKNGSHFPMPEVTIIPY